jgi:hypothetical protein
MVLSLCADVPKFQVRVLKKRSCHTCDRVYLNLSSSLPRPNWVERPYANLALVISFPFLTQTGIGPNYDKLAMASKFAKNIAAGITRIYN